VSRPEYAARVPALRRPERAAFVWTRRPPLGASRLGYYPGRPPAELVQFPALDVGEVSEPSGELDEASPTPGLGAAETSDLIWCSGGRMLKLLRHEPYVTETTLAYSSSEQRSLFPEEQLHNDRSFTVGNRTIYQAQSQELRNLFEDAGHPRKVMCVALSVTGHLLPEQRHPPWGLRERSAG